MTPPAMKVKSGKVTWVEMEMNQLAISPAMPVPIRMPRMPP
jgi:hypothetical protein